MAPHQPRKAAHQGSGSSSTLSRSSGISKSRESQTMSRNGAGTHLTENHARTRPVILQLQSHATARAKQSSVGIQASLPSGPQAPTAASSATTATVGPPIYVPKVLHRPHPDSQLYQNFHWIPYPLGLMPYESWHSMHHRPSPSSKYRFRCPVCYQERIATAHARKVFLVAERLTWNDTIVSTHDRDLNEILNWAVNYEVGILEPCVEGGKLFPGGKMSQKNQFYPYQNEYEMKLALKLVFMMDELTPATWALWIGAQISFQQLLNGEEPASDGAGSDPGRTDTVPEKTAASLQSTSPEDIEMIDLTGSPEPESKHQTTIPSSSMILAKNSFAQRKSTENANQPCQSETASIKQPQPCKRTLSYKTLQDFYSLLDKIERTSYVGALFLEAYAEKLRDDMCKSCWFRHNIQLDLF